MDSRQSFLAGMVTTAAVVMFYMENIFESPTTYDVKVKYVEVEIPAKKPNFTDEVKTINSSLNNSKRLLNCNENELEGRIEKLLKDKKELENQVKRNKSLGLLQDLDSYLSESKFIDDISVISMMTQAESIEELKDLGSALINKISKGAVVLGGMNEKPILLIC